MNEDFMAVVINKLDMFAEVIQDIGNRVEALERIARRNTPPNTYEVSDIKKPTLLNYKDEQKLKRLVKKDGKWVLP